MAGRFDSTGERRRAAQPFAALLWTLALGLLPTDLGAQAQAQAQGTGPPSGSAAVRKPATKGQAAAAAARPVPTPTPPTPVAMPKDAASVEPEPIPDFNQPPPLPMPAPREGERPKFDPALTRTEGPAPADAADPGLPPAREAGGGGGGGAAKAEGDEADAFTLPADRLPVGKGRVQLSVEVHANPVLNLGKESTVKLIVINESNTDAFGVTVVYQLPDGLEYVSATPEGVQAPVNKSLYVFKKPVVSGNNGEWTIVLKVVARSVKPCEHTASVTAKAGSRASTTVQEPKLKVEVNVSPSRLLKGRQATYEIVVTNPGSGPARNVVVQAKLTSGLKVGSEDVVEQVIKLIRVGERVALDALIVDAVAGGQQSVTVDVTSPDVNQVIADHKVVRSVEVTRPELVAKVSGPEYRYTNQACDYKITVTNPGTAPTQNVNVVATMPSAGGKMAEIPQGATWDKNTRKLRWRLDRIEPAQSIDLTFPYLTNAAGLYRVAIEATAGELKSMDQFSTEVSGLAVLDLQVSQDTRIIDVGQTTYYDIKIKNTGTKEATNLSLSGTLTNLTVVQDFGLEKGEAKINPDGKIIFPLIDRLDPGSEKTLSLELKPKGPGAAKGSFSLGHADQGDEGNVEDVIATTVTGNGRTRPPGK